MSLYSGTVRPRSASVSRLAGADLPSASEGVSYFREGDHSTGIRVRQPLLDRSHDVEVVEDIVEAAVVGQAIQKLSNLLLGFHNLVPRLGALMIRHALAPIARTPHTGGLLRSP